MQIPLKCAVSIVDFHEAHLVLMSLTQAQATGWFERQTFLIAGAQGGKGQEEGNLNFAYS